MLKIGRNQRLEYLKKSKKEQKNTNEKTKKLKIKTQDIGFEKQ